MSGLAPRALRHCAPSAPWGASVRRLNFTVRHPDMSIDLSDRVTISTSGRAGRINANVDGELLTFDWEFGGGDVVAFVFVATPQDWVRRDPWSRFERGAVLEALAKEICRLRCKGCTFRIGDRSVEFFAP